MADDVPRACALRDAPRVSAPLGACYVYCNCVWAGKVDVHIDGDGAAPVEGVPAVHCSALGSIGKTPSSCQGKSPTDNRQGC